MKPFVIVVLCFLAVGSAAALSVYNDAETMNATTGQTVSTTLRILNENDTVLPSILFATANDSVVINGRMGQFHDTMTILNDSFKEIVMKFVVNDAGEYDIKWGIWNASTNISYSNTSNTSFHVIVTGNSTNITGINESEDWMRPPQRYGTGSVDIVKQRLANKPAPKANVTNTTQNVSPPIQPPAPVPSSPPPPVAKPAPIPPAPPAPIYTPPTPLTTPNVTNMTNTTTNEPVLVAEYPVPTVVWVAALIAVCAGAAMMAVARWMQ